MKKSKKKNIVVIGGGTGSYTVLSGLKKYQLALSAIVTMADEGGSTGILRDELGVLPPGDVRQCLVALSSSDLLMRELMNYRFDNGRLKGHSFGNLLLSALEKVTGSFDLAVERASEILRLQGHVIPATLQQTHLIAYLRNGKVVRGEDNVQGADLLGLRRIALQPKAAANPKALEAISRADTIIIGPGDFYSSLVPNLLVQGIAQAVCKSKAKKIYVCNLMTKARHTDAWGVGEYAAQLERYLGCSLDTVVYNSRKPQVSVFAKYARKGEQMVSVPKGPEKTRFVGADLLNKRISVPQKADRIQRSLIRHDSDKLARLLLKL